MEACTYVVVGAELLYDNRAWYILLEHDMQKTIPVVGHKRSFFFAKGQAKARGSTRLKLGRPYLTNDG